MRKQFQALIEEDYPVRNKYFTFYLPSLTQLSFVHQNVILLLSFLLTFLSFQDIMRNQKTKSQFNFTMILAQIVTVYLENHSKNQFHQTLELSPVVIIKDFWARITPVLYRLLRHSQRVSLVNFF